jgi:hypothetical protein
MKSIWQSLKPGLPIATSNSGSPYNVKNNSLKENKDIPLKMTTERMCIM